MNTPPASDNSLPLIHVEDEPMSDLNHKECFGTMFPDDLHLKKNTPNEGKVFTVQLESADGVMPVTSDRSISIDDRESDTNRPLNPCVPTVISSVNDSEPHTHSLR